MALLTDPSTPEPLETQFCSGALVASKYVVTTAQCVHSHTPTSLYGLLGDPDGEHSQILSFSNIMVHENYTASSETDNIAVLKLTTNVDMNIYTPVCLAEPRDGEVLGGVVGQVYEHGSGERNYQVRFYSYA